MIARESDTPCPTDIVAVAVKADLTHCGIVYPDQATAIFCDLRQRGLGIQPLPGKYYWTRVRLAPHNVEAVAALLELVIQRDVETPIAYSVRYTPNAINILGKLADGVDGFTCATFVVAIFEAIGIPLIDTKTWKSRPKEDEEFRQVYLMLAQMDMAPISGADLARISAEKMDFRIKPAEVCGAATHSKYPANFPAAVKAAEKVGRLIVKNEEVTPLAILRRPTAR